MSMVKNDDTTRSQTMKKLTLIGILATFFLAGCGVTDEQPVEGGQWKVDDSEGTAVPGCTPGDEPVWTQTTQEPWYVPGRVQFSQNDGLFVLPHDWLGRTRVQRTTDGTTFDLPSYGQNHALDKSWDLMLETDTEQQVTRLVRRSTDEVLLDLIPERAQAELKTVEIAASGRSVAAITCAEGLSRLLLWSVDRGELTRAEDIGAEREYCNNWNGVGEQLVFGPAERTLVVVQRATGELHHIDLTTGERTSALVEVSDPSADAPRASRWPVIDAHVGPNGRRILLSTGSGRVELRRLPGFERINSYESAVHGLNAMTYAPRIPASPVGFAPDGRRFASLSADGNVVVRNLDGEQLQSFPRAVADPDEMWGMEDVPVAVGFSHDGTHLVVGHYFGSALYACDGAELPRSEQDFDADVRLDGPTEIRTEEAYEWTASVDGHEGAVMRFTVDGEKVPARSDGTLSWRGYEPGTYEIAVEADDGRASGRATLNVSVEE
jgi:hypothetical protein